VGDPNAQVGNVHLRFDEVVGKHGHKRMNENGDLFIE
jgi:hypothetical protein